MSDATAAADLKATPTPPNPPATEPKAPADAKIEEPQLLAGKFKSPADLEKAYKELEKKLGKPPEQRDEPELASIDDLVAKAGLKLDDLSKKWTEKGALEADDYAKFKAIGRSKAEIDALASGMAAKQALMAARRDQAINEAAEAIGGKEAFDQVLKDAKDFLKPEDIGAYNDMLDNPDTVRAAAIRLSALRDAWAGTNGSKALVNGQHGGAPALPKNPQEFGQLRDAALRGDQDALKRIAAMPASTIDGWKRFGTKQM